MWVVLSDSLIGSGDVPAVRVGDVFTIGLELNNPIRIPLPSPATDQLRPLADGRRGEYEVLGVARSSALTWILEAGDLRMTVYEDGRTPPAVGQPVALRGQLCVAGDYVWDLATDPTQEGAPYDGRRAWRVDQLEPEEGLPRRGVSAEAEHVVDRAAAAAATGLDEHGRPGSCKFYLLDVSPA